ncbi:MAG: phosphoribosylamine--glycine ligase [Flavobacteriales bacterium]|nr:phosphoribosylamine--glycine ligase [Flavobacteriales bacterium]
MNVLILGSGGREHAMAWKISQSSLLSNLYIAPGNAGTAHVGVNVDVAVDDFKAIRKLVLEKKIQLVVVGPEGPLVQGIADFFAADKDLKNVGLIGPDARAAQLEGSKDFAKQFMMKHGVPTAKYATFTKNTLKEGKAFLATLKPPFVLKADGLAAGKGVLIVNELKAAEEALATLLNGQFGTASEKVVIEEFLKGIEMSVFILTDGDSYKILPEAKDYKRIGEGDTGLNTGGMGAVSPVPFVTPEFLDKIETQVIIPTMKGLKAEGIKYRGFIFFGLIKVGNEPYVIEYNCRMGDPETEVVIPRIKSDFLNLLEGAATGTLSEQHVETDPRSAVTVMLVSKGYPESSDKGKEIKGLELVKDAVAFHAGTKFTREKVVSNGGRVIAVTAYGNDMDDALDKAYRNANVIEFSGKNLRKDIGFDLKKYLEKA